VKASVNLRGDLAKLSNAELAERLERTWQALDAGARQKEAGLVLQGDRSLIAVRERRLAELKQS
jgi:hypothetical protein